MYSIKESNTLIVTCLILISIPTSKLTASLLFDVNEEHI